MTRGVATTLVAAAAALPAGCGEERRLDVVRVEPPAGSTAEGRTSTRRTPADDPSGQPIFRFSAREGQTLSFTVVVRNVAREAVTVTGARTDLDKGPFAGQEVEGAPVAVPPGAEATLTVRGRILGCAYDGQLLALPDPELVLRTADGGEATQTVRTGVRLEYIAPRMEDC